MLACIPGGLLSKLLKIPMQYWWWLCRACQTIIYAITFKQRGDIKYFQSLSHSGVNCAKQVEGLSKIFNGAAVSCSYIIVESASEVRNSWEFPWVPWDSHGNGN